MKLTQKLLEQLIQEEIRHMASRYGGTVGKIPNAKLHARVRELHKQIGDKEFIEQFILQAPDKVLSDLFVRIAKSKQLTIDGVKYVGGG